MEIRLPKDERYKKGNLDPNVIYTKNLKLEASQTRPKKEFNSPIEMMRSEMWFPNKDITTTHIKNEIGKIEGIRIVKYVPDNVTNDNLIIYFHGGGYYGGSTNTVQNSCRYIAEQTKSTVISVDYSLAPEFPYPTALNEGYTILKHLKMRYKNIYLCGDSAGAGLACAVSIKDIEENTNICKGLIMYYPVVLIDLKDNVMEDFKWDIKEYDIDSSSEDFAFIKSEASGLKYAMPFIKNAYVGEHESKENYYISPICTPNEILEKFPKTLIFTVEYDYLRLEAEYFYERLLKLGIKTKGIRYAGQTHAFIDKIGFCDQVIDSVAEMVRFIND